MAYGANIGDKTWAFSLTTPRGLVKLAAMDEEGGFNLAHFYLFLANLYFF